MRALFDVNVLIALFDPAHIHHKLAHEWLEEHRTDGWATCPITENGCIRILSQPKYPNTITTADALRRLSRATSSKYHDFWSDDLSLTEASAFAIRYILGPRQLTDIYLLGLAVKKGGRLVTFDRSIEGRTVTEATEENLIVLR